MLFRCGLGDLAIHISHNVDHPHSLTIEIDVFDLRGSNLPS